MSITYTGLDVGSTTCHLVGLDPGGRKVFSRRIDTDAEHLLSAIADIPGEIHLHLEASTAAGWIYRLLLGCVKRIVVGHPRTNAWIAKDARKSDKVDAYKLAELLRVNRLHPVYCPDDPARAEFKAIVQQYEYLTRSEVRIKQRIAARLRAHGLFHQGKAAFTAGGREEVIGQIPDDWARRSLLELCALLDTTLHSQGQGRRLMRQAATQFPEIALFQGVPGIGLIGACRFSAYIQTPDRFPNKRKLWRYCGLGIVDRSSDGKPLGRLKLDRSAVLCLKDMSRKAFSGAMRCSRVNSLRRAFESTLRRTHNATHARLSTQRKLLAILLRMWKENSPYRPDCA